MAKKLGTEKRRKSTKIQERKEKTKKAIFNFLSLKKSKKIKSKKLKKAAPHQKEGRKKFIPNKNPKRRVLRDSHQIGFFETNFNPFLSIKLSSNNFIRQRIQYFLLNYSFYRTGTKNLIVAFLD